MNDRTTLERADMGALNEPTVDLYEDDFHAWTFDQAEKLKRRDFKHIDLANLIEEIESLGRSERHELGNRLAQLLMHLLKWEHQDMERSRSWVLTVKEQRRRLELLFKRMPSLRPRLGEVLPEAYSDARLMAERGTRMNLSHFPIECPYSLEEILDPTWLPAVDWLAPDN